MVRCREMKVVLSRVYCWYCCLVGGRRKYVWFLDELVRVLSEIVDVVGEWGWYLLVYMLLLSVLDVLVVVVYLCGLWYRHGGVFLRKWGGEFI